jgi:hypothetical protein
VLDLGGQIRRAVAFFFIAAARRWQALLQVMLAEARISPNKVRKGSFELGFSGQPRSWAVLPLLHAVLWRLEIVMKRRSGGFHKAEPLVFCCNFFDPSPLASGKKPESDGGLVHPARQWEARFSGFSGAESFFLLCRSGCGKEDRRFGSGFPQGDLTASYGDHQRWRPTAAVIPGTRSHSVPWQFRCHGVFNLQARVPLWRPFSSSAAATNVAPSPSGLVPGDGVDGRCVELLISGGEGSDCIPISLGKILFVKSKDLVVTVFYFEALDVICNSTE